MNTGIQDAYNLAWKLAFVLKGAAAVRLLTTYNEERLPNARRLLQTTDRMFNLAAGTDWLVNVIRTTVFPPMAKFILSFDAVKKKFFPLVSQIGINYRQSSLSAHDSDEDFGVKAGDRLPYFLVDGRSVYDQLHAPGFQLLTFSDGHDAFEKLRTEIASLEIVDHHVIPLRDDVTKIFGTRKPFSVLLRPDNYLAFISPDTSVAPVIDYLKALAT